MPFLDLHYTFPTELLSEIFLHVISSSSPTPTTSISYPLLVSHICTHWRAAAISTPRLWARLFLQLSLSNADSQAEMTQTWMARSGGCPLTLFVFWEDPPFSENHPVLDCLLKYSARWKEMFFYLPFGVYKNFTTAGGKLPLPMLTELSLGTGSDAPELILSPTSDTDLSTDTTTSTLSTLPDSENETQLQTLQMFQIAPCLKSLECVNLSPFLFSFPWNNLTNIPLMAVTMEECFSILLQATLLEKAGFIFLPVSLTATSLSNTTIPSLRPLVSITHPTLTSLSILTSPWDESIDISPIFPLLTLPQLTSLTICNLKSHFGTNGFFTFLSRLESLRTLHLRKTSLSDQNLAQGLKVVPSVEKLVVHPLPISEGPPTVTENVLDELTWKAWVVDGVDEEFRYLDGNGNGNGTGEGSEIRNRSHSRSSSSSSSTSSSNSSTSTNNSTNTTTTTTTTSTNNDDSQKNPKRTKAVLPLLPKLSSIEIKLDNTLADAFIHMIHSRRTSVHFPSRPIPNRRVMTNSGINSNQHVDNLELKRYPYVYTNSNSNLNSNYLPVTQPSQTQIYTTYTEHGHHHQQQQHQIPITTSNQIQIQTQTQIQIPDPDKSLIEEEEEEYDKPVTLCHIRVRYSEPLNQHFISELEDLQADGLDIELDYMNEMGGVRFENGVGDGDGDGDGIGIGIGDGIGVGVGIGIGSGDVDGDGDGFGIEV